MSFWSDKEDEKRNDLIVASFPIGFCFKLLGSDMIVIGHCDPSVTDGWIHGVDCMYKDHAGLMRERFFYGMILADLLKGVAT